MGKNWFWIDILFCFVGFLVERESEGENWEEERRTLSFFSLFYRTVFVSGFISTFLDFWFCIIGGERINMEAIIRSVVVCVLGGWPNDNYFDSPDYIFLFLIYFFRILFLSI